MAKMTLNKFECLLILIVTLISLGCNSSHFTEEGAKEVEIMRKKYGCFEIIRGDGTQSDRNGKQVRKFVNIRFAKCNDKMNYDSIQNYPLFRQEIADKIYPMLLDTKNYDGLNLQFTFEKAEAMGNKNYFYAFDKSTNKLVLSDSSFVDKF
ncbi:MAG: hypothetical protein M3R27_13060 [Bacteroidota bacterium]|nr:hypothetical protein [Bacteroidota bacterium]